MDEREKAAGHRRNSASSLVDPNIPRLVCQSCRHAICVVGIESDNFSNDPSRSGLQASSIQSSILGSIQMDNSFVVLPKKRAQVPSVPAHHHIGNPLSDTTNAKKTIEDSFIVLPPAAASIYKSKSVAEGGEAHLATGGNTNSSAFHSTVDVLQRAFEIASNQTQVEQPLCLECLPILSNKFDQEIEDINKDIKAYECYLKNSKDKSYDMLSDEDFLKEKLKLEKEERKLNAAIEETEKQFAEVNAELEDLDSKSLQFKELKERYWHDFNDFQFQLTTHQEERDSILAKIEVSQAHLELLKKTNVLNDAFTIWHSGDFGTINNFRLGRLPNIPVEWDEINAAWGQACLLLHTMAQYFYPKFPYQIKINPMGSYPRILDHNKNSFELFGPVNLFWSTRYDKAMTLFLTCLNDFAEFANRMDRENNIPVEKCFKFPYKIENDRVEDYTITQSFNKPENWTKSLKYTLCNLKWALYWFIGNTDFQPVSNMVHSHN